MLITLKQNESTQNGKKNYKFMTYAQHTRKYTALKIVF